MDAGLLEVVANGNFLLNEGDDFLLFKPEEGLLVHLQGLFQGRQLPGKRLRETIFREGLFHLVKKGPGR